MLSACLCHRLLTKPSQATYSLCLDLPTYKTVTVIFIVIPFCFVWSILTAVFLETGLFLVLYFGVCLSLTWGTCIMPAGLTPKQIR